MDKKLKTFPQISQDAVEVYKKTSLKTRKMGSMTEKISKCLTFNHNIANILL